MKRILSALFPLVLAFSPLIGWAQQIIYSEPEREDSRRTNFDIIGKVGGNYLVFKNNNSNGAISVYGEDMKLIQRVNLDFLPDHFNSVEFVSYPDFCYMIYEYQHKGIVHCTAARIDGKGERMGPPIDLDTTQLAYSSSNKIYTIAVSEDKQKILVFKINSKNPRNFLFTTFLFDSGLKLIDRHRMPLAMEERNELFTDFLVDNEGAMVFGRFLRSGGNDYVSRVAIVTHPATADSFDVKDIGAGDRLLDEIRMKVDNNNHRYILSGFYYKQKRGNIEGLYSVVWDKNSDSRFKENLYVFSDELRAAAKSSDSNVKMAFNDFFIKHIIIKRDGGYLVVAESLYTTSRGSMFNRWDYMGNPMGPGYGYYSPYYSPYYNPWNRGYMGNAVRYHAENILILSFDKEGNLAWSNIVPKSQFDDDSENQISHQLMNTGGELHFLYNQYERRNLLLNDQSIAPDGKLTRYPTLRNLDKGYDFMPRYGKQVSSTQTIIPCMYRNYLCFAKIDF
ncbi:MAG: hypothetical protein P4L51_20765 [Puia sp.]|nr:hypothetical protein [Puia sp.]